MAPSLSLPNHHCLVFRTVSGNTYEPSVACAIAYSCQSQGLTIGISFQIYLLAKKKVPLDLKKLLVIIFHQPENNKTLQSHHWFFPKSPHRSWNRTSRVGFFNSLPWVFLYLHWGKHFFWKRWEIPAKPNHLAKLFHQPRFPWNKWISLTKPPFGVRSCVVAMIWPEPYHWSQSWHSKVAPIFGIFP